MNPEIASITSRKQHQPWLLLLLPLWFLLYNYLQPLTNLVVDDLFSMPKGNHLTESVRFFIFEVPKVLLLLTLIIFGVGIIRTYFSPERTRKALEGKSLLTGNVMASMLGIVTPFCSCSAIPLFLGFAVLSVDGVNAVSGQTANPDQTGYVLAPFESTEISGWRKNLDEVAQFNFTALPNSYAARTGRPANVGVIGVAVFTERVPVWRQREEIAREAAPPAPASAPMDAQAQHAAAANAGAARSLPAQPAAPAKTEGLARRDERLGTGHGAREYAHVDTTTFERASPRPAETVAIWYDSYANLVAQGIIERPIADREPQPFPRAFVPDPPAAR